MTRPTILVTSAAGHTGQPIVEQLLAKGFPVRAMVRRMDARAEALSQLGAKVIIGDMFDYRDLRRAMQGVQRAYHCPPYSLNVLHSTMLFAMAAEEAKLEVVALMSQWNPHAIHPSIITREHWIANHAIRWMPSVDVVHINPGLFASSYFFGLPAMAHFGMFMAPFGNGKNAPPSDVDIARVAVGALADPSRHIGKSYRPTGPKLLSPQDIAADISVALNRKVKYQNTSFAMFSKAAIALGFPLSELAHFRYYAEDLAHGGFALGGATDHVEEVSGKAPESFLQTAQRYVDDPSRIRNGLQIGGTMAAYRFLLKMLGTKPADLDTWEEAQGYPRLKSPQLAKDSADWVGTASQQKLNLLPAVLPRATEHVSSAA
jgi:NAD(P)H dehydrogenase (quinone)